MASWTDKTPIFNEYVAQQPVEAMARVGMAKQAQYEQGYQKIQESIDKVAGLEIVRDVDKNYLQGKLDSLGTKLLGVAGGDFSNFQLTNSVAGMAGEIVDDENIQNAVISTKRYKDQSAIVAEAQKKGEATPDNLYHWQKQNAEYFNSEDPGAVYSGAYTPHFDVFGFAKETFDAVKPDNMSFDEIYVLGADGKPVQDAKGNLQYSKTMTRMIKKGVMPQKVKQTLDQIFSDPRVSTQLGITGEYNYRTASPDMLAKRIIDEKHQVLGALKEQEETIRLDTSLGLDMQAELDKLDQQRTAISSRYDQSAQMARQNPDAARGALYLGEVRSKYTTMFGHMSTDTKVMANPAWEADFKIAKEANAHSRWAQDKAWQREEKRQDQDNWQKTFDQRERLTQQKIDADAKLNGGQQNTTGDFMAPKTNFDVVVQQEQDYAQASNNYESTSNELLWSTILPTRENESILTKLENNDMSREEAISFIVRKEALAGASREISPGVLIDDLSPLEQREWEDKVVSEYRTDLLSKVQSTFSTLTPEMRKNNTGIVSLYNKFSSAKRLYTNEMIRNENIEKQLVEKHGQLGKEMGKINPPVINYDGDEYVLTQQDVVDLATVRRGTTGGVFGGLFESRETNNASKAARTRLDRRNKGHLVEVMNDDLAMRDRLNSQDIGGYTISNDVASNMSNQRDWDEVEKAVHYLRSGDRGDKRFEDRANVIRNNSFTHQPQKMSLLGPKDGPNKDMVRNLGELAAVYKANNQNYSGDFDKFAVNINTVIEDDGSLDAGITKDEDGSPLVEVRLYDNENTQVGSMTMTNEEAASVGINSTQLFDKPKVSSVRSLLKWRNGRTSVGLANQKETYEGADSYYKKDDFLSLNSFPGDVQVNFKDVGGVYTGHVYIDDGVNEPFIFNTPSDQDLGQLLETVQSVMNTSYINSIIQDRYGKAD